MCIATAEDSRCTICCTETRGCTLESRAANGLHDRDGLDEALAGEALTQDHFPSADSSLSRAST